MTENELCPQHSGLVTELENRKENDIKLWEAVEKLQNRLPNWATWSMSILTFMLGLACGWIGALSNK